MLCLASGASLESVRWPRRTPLRPATRGGGYYCASAYPDPDSPAVTKLRSSPGAGAKALPVPVCAGVITKFSVRLPLLAVPVELVLVLPVVVVVVPDVPVDELLTVIVPEQSEFTV
jgi:hypothetical protein